MAPRPRSTSSRSTSRYTRVLPLPVTPNSTTAPPARTSRMVRMASACSGVGCVGGAVLRFSNGSRNRSRSSICATPRSIRPRTVPRENPSSEIMRRSATSPPRASSVSYASRWRLARPNMRSRCTNDPRVSVRRTTGSAPGAGPTEGATTCSSTAPERDSRWRTLHTGRFKRRANAVADAFPPARSSASTSVPPTPRGAAAPSRNVATSREEPHSAPGSMALRVRPMGAA